jgi:hypothetical protein
VIIETEEEMAFSGSRDPRSRRMLCPACRRPVEVVTPEQAVRMDGVSARAASPAESDTREAICTCFSRR